MTLKTAGSVGALLAPVFHILHGWRRATEQRRWAGKTRPAA